MGIRQSTDHQGFTPETFGEILPFVEPFRINSLRDVIALEGRVRHHAVGLIRAIRSEGRSEMSLFEDLRFGTSGCHPVSGRPLNPIEQINESWTFLVALEATRWLLQQHPESDGFLIAPGAHMAQPLDIMSVKPGLVGAETFAAVRVSNNNKLRRDIEKLQSRTELHRYVMFASPLHQYPETTRLHKRERCASVQVWAVNIGLAKEIRENMWKQA